MIKDIEPIFFPNFHTQSKTVNLKTIAYVSFMMVREFFRAQFWLKYGLFWLKCAKFQLCISYYYITTERLKTNMEMDFHKFIQIQHYNVKLYLLTS